MPPNQATEGLAAARVIRAEFPETAILVLSAHAEVEHAMELLASGQSIGYAGIARQLWVTEGTVEKHVRSILIKLRVPETGDDHRRVRAVITFLEAR